MKCQFVLNTVAVVLIACTGDPSKVTKASAAVQTSPTTTSFKKEVLDRELPPTVRFAGENVTVTGVDLQVSVDGNPRLRFSRDGTILFIDTKHNEGVVAHRLSDNSTLWAKKTFRQETASLSLHPQKGLVMAGMVHAQGLKIRRDRKKPYDREFLKIWEAATGSEVYSERRFPVGEAAFAPDGNRYIVQNGRSLEMRDLETHKRIYSIKNAVFDGFTSDNQFILTESRDSKIYDNSKSGPAVYLDTLLPDRRNYLVEVRRVVDGSIQHLIKGTIFADNVDRPGYLSPDGRHVITHQWSGAVSIWNVASGKALPGLEEVVPNAADATFSNSGKYVAVAARENHLQVFRFPSATPVRSLLFQMDVNETVWGLAFSADDQYVALQTTSCIRVWSVETAALVLDVKRSRAGFAFSPVKNELVIVSPSKFNMLVCEFLRRARR